MPNKANSIPTGAKVFLRIIKSVYTIIHFPASKMLLYVLACEKRNVQF